MANEMRDRLVELMVEADAYDGYECKLCTDDHSCFRCYFTKLADHLIENGVVVPPCKVGDTVWILFAVEKTIEGREIASIMQRNTSWTMTFTNGSCFTVWDNEDDEYFGKTVFLTKAEAEQKLKEMRGGNDL